MFYIFASLPKAWSGGRVARQWSAKPRTAVRIRSRPHKKVNSTTELTFFYPFLYISFYSIYFKKTQVEKNSTRKKPS